MVTFRTLKQVILAFFLSSSMLFICCGRDDDPTTPCDKVSKGARLADLIISGIKSISHQPDDNRAVIIEIGETIVLSSKILNESGTDCTPEEAAESLMKVVVTLFEGNSAVGSADTVYSTPKLLADEDVDLNTSLTFTEAGEYELQHIADGADQVEERNEANNYAIVFEILNWILEIIEGGRQSGDVSRYRILVIDGCDDTPAEGRRSGQFVKFG